MVTVGIDYSMGSPSICVHRGTTFSFEGCMFYYLTTKKKYEGTHGKMIGHLYPVLEGMERFDAISDWAITVIKNSGAWSCTIEDYAFAAPGRVFHIAENTGLLKYKIWQNRISLCTIAPTSLKKFATGKGNAKKEDMEVAFINETSYNPKAVLGMTEKQWNPSSDVIDSYYICKFGHNNPAVA